MHNIGTGHQSAVIINLYKQLGYSIPGKTLFLFEEPDAHLHPPTIRAIGNELVNIANRDQVLISTHSPILISHLGLEKVLHLKHNKHEGTKVFPTNLVLETQKTLAHKLLKYGLRITEALFTKLVVLVEGPTDAIVIGRLVELISRRSTDQLDFIITPAGGKDNIVEIAQILKQLNVEWVALFDFDAALTTSSIPITNNTLLNNVNTISALNELQQNLNNGSTRGQKANTQIMLILNELTHGSPVNEYYNNSTLKKLMHEVCGLSSTRAISLQSALQNERVQVIRDILSKNNVWLMRPDLENTLIGRNNTNVAHIDTILRREGLIRIRNTDPNYIGTIKKALHSLAASPVLLVEIVDLIDSHSGFNRSDLNMAAKQIVELVDTV